ncbi:syntaxin-like protein [Achlya hypogyna]|uniref:Syntaxin-like protein n=1 Tax=Achlya hypogyna TaxID=1202772 RepID=A0A1V9ZNX5_ACHHY|nr:syntaxin-like protein [Achlya hypogyna]
MAHRDLTAKFMDRRYSAHRRQQHIMESKRQGGSKPYVSAFGKALMQPHHRRGLHEMETGNRQEEVSKPSWTQAVDVANECMTQLQQKLEYLQKMHTRRLMVRFDDSESQHDSDIDAMTQDISQLFHRAEAALHKVTREPLTAASIPSSAERTVRVNVQRALASKLQDLSARYRRSQREYMETLRSQRHVSNEVFGLDRHPADEARQLLQYQHHDHDDYTIQAREREIHKIAKSIVDLSTVFKELANMVIDQGTVIDRIDYNMDLVVTRVQSGLKELHRAEKFQNNTRPTRCIYLLLSLISLCFMILLMKHATPYVEY